MLAWACPLSLGCSREWPLVATEKRMLNCRAEPKHEPVRVRITEIIAPRGARTKGRKAGRSKHGH